MSNYTELFDQMFIVACRIHDVDIRDTLLRLIIEGKEQQTTVQQSHTCDQIFLTACRISDVDTRDTLLALINKVKEHLQQHPQTSEEVNETQTPENVVDMPSPSNDDQTVLEKSKSSSDEESTSEEPKPRKRRRP